MNFSSIIKWSSVVICFVVHPVFAQQTKEFIADGIKVILKPSAKQIISAQLFVRGGTANYSKKQEGIEAMAFTIAMDGGTTNKSKNDFTSEAEKLGTSFSKSTTLDYGNLSVTCIRSAWNASWNLFTDALLNPAFKAEEFEKERDKMFANIKQRESSADASLRELAMEHVFTGQNYAKKTEGSEESLQALKVEDVKQYFKSTICKSRCFLVIVGDVSEQDIRAKIKASLAKLPQGRAATTEPRVLITKSSEKIVDRKIATNYLLGVMSAPKFNSEDGFPMLMAFNILYDRFFVELRTKRSLSYAPQASYNRDALSNPFSLIYISTTKPKDAIDAMIAILDSAKKYGITKKELEDQKQSFLTTYFMKLETAEAQSNALGRAEILGNWKLDDQFNKMVEATTLAQANDAIRKYTNAIMWTYLGKKEMVSTSDFKQPIKYNASSKPY